MTLEQIIAVIIQIAIFGYFVGSLSQKVGNTAQDTTKARKDISLLNKDFELHKDNQFSVFITKDSCEALNKQRDLKIINILEQREIFNRQNTKEHLDMIRQFERAVKTQTIQADKTNTALDKIAEMIKK